MNFKSTEYEIENLIKFLKLKTLNFTFDKIFSIKFLLQLLKKIIFYGSCVLIILIKPLFAWIIVIIIIILSFPEHLFLIKHLVLFFKFKKKKKYFSFQIKKPILEKQSNIELWKNISDLNAFKKFYIITKKKKISFTSFFVIILFYLSAIPFRLLKIFTDLYWAQGSNLNARLRFIYLLKHKEIENCKIEVLDKKIYTNMRNLDELIKVITKVYPNFNKTEYIHLLSVLSKQTQVFWKYENDPQYLVKTFMTKIKTEDGKNIPKVHPSPQYKIEISLKKYLPTDFSNESGKFYMYSTSNVPVNLTSEELPLAAIAELVKKGAKNPGTLVIKNPDKYMPIREFNTVSTIRLEGVLLDGKEKFSEKFKTDLTFKHIDYLLHKRKSFTDIFDFYTDCIDASTAQQLTLNKQIINNIVGEMTLGYWDNAFQGYSDYDTLLILQKIEQFGEAE